ncbi:MAG: tetratricopeptide repeat protein [candidate division Zixibacteria bacterium]|nr:tetratricopeptide repeat protein [candidate division Zixibacteria bacterium]
MTDDTPQQKSDQTQTDAPQGTSNRYVLIAVLAVVVVVTVMLLRQNMEPPPQQQQTQQPQSGQEQADTQARMEEMQQQIAHVEEILAQDSTNFDAWAALGNLYYDANMPEEAIHHYEEALKLKPDDLHVRTDMATMMRAQGQAEEAVDILDGVIADDSSFTQAWFNLGVIHTFDLKQNAKAVHAWEQYLELEPNSQHADAIRKEIDRMKAEM